LDGQRPVGAPAADSPIFFVMALGGSAWIDSEQSAWMGRFSHLSALNCIAVFSALNRDFRHIDKSRVFQYLEITVILHRNIGEF
jgi:hypothetical protein